MLKPSADLIIDPKQSRYSLVVGVAKRARQIVEEAEKNGQILIEKPVDLAVQLRMTTNRKRMTIRWRKQRRNRNFRQRMSRNKGRL